jgi:hypothetical protein
MVALPITIHNNEVLFFYLVKKMNFKIVQNVGQISEEDAIIMKHHFKQH